MASKAVIALIVVAFLGAAFLITGGVLVRVFPGIINSLVDGQIVLKQGSDSFKMWEAPKTPIYFQVWMFDIANPQEVLKGGKPAVKQIGPYTYFEKRQKLNITFNKDDTVTYRETRTFFFNRSMSAGPESDTFTTLNLPLLTIYDMLRYKPSWEKRAAEALIVVEKEKFFTKLSVGDLMWGYDDPLISILHKIVDVLHLNMSVPAKFGLFYDQNGTDDGLYKIHTGVGDIHHFAEIVSWNNAKKLNYWTSDIANMINGSDGTLYPPHINLNKTKYLFSSDLCRSLGMDFTKPVTNKGIDMDRFVAPQILFANSTVNTANAGFCTPKGDCLPSGLLNASVCRQGAPIVMSMPHFLGCDPSVQDSIVGLHPNQEEHQSFIDVEPMTGVVMNAGKRLQINVYIDKIDGFSVTDHLKPTFQPLMWLNESGLIDKKDADEFKSEVYGKITLTVAVKFGLIALGGFMLLIVIIIFARRIYVSRVQEKHPLIVNSDDKASLISDGAVYA